MDQMVNEEELPGVKVLVIDDSKTIRRSAENLLSKEGYDVITATDGFDALAKIADARPEIIFVDIMMPRLDGYQTCALIKNNSILLTRCSGCSCCTSTLLQLISRYCRWNNVTKCCSQTSSESALTHGPPE